MTTRFNTVQPRRGAPFRIADYPPAVQDLLQEKLRPVDEIVRSLPRRLRFFASFALGQPRGILRRLHIRDDWEEVYYLNALVLEPYPILANPRFFLRSGYFSPLDRLVADKLGKTIAHVPKQFCQFGEVLRSPDYLDAYFHSVTPPDAEGYVNLGTSVDVALETIRHFHATGRQIIFEINSHVPWVQGHARHDGNRVPLAWASAAYELHEPLAQLPPLAPSEAEQAIARHVLPFIEDGDTLQFGIGGVPNFIAAQIRDRRGLKIHSEMLTDAMVDLQTAGAIDSAGKGYMDGLIIGTFAAGTDKLYDWLDRNPAVMLLPVDEVNDVRVIAQNQRLKSINSTILVDFNGQAASDAIGSSQVSGIGGQLEFVTGAQLSPGGRSLLCLKSCNRVRGELRSCIVPTLPAGTPVSVPRPLVDLVVTEHGVADLRLLDSVDRVHALVEIADPRFRAELIAAARAQGLWERRPGFGSFKQRALFNHLGWVRRVLGRVEQAPQRKAAILLEEGLQLLRAPDLVARTRAFYEKNRTPRRVPAASGGEG